MDPEGFSDVRNPHKMEHLLGFGDGAFFESL